MLDGLTNLPASLPLGIDDGLIPIALLGGVLLLIGGAIGASLYFEKKRREALRAFAEEAGLRFAPDAPAPAAFQNFELSQKGHSQRCRNLIEGDTDAVTLDLFDWHYTTGGGKNASHHRQTVVTLGSPDLAALPQLTLGPESVFHRIGGAFGYQDIDFGDHPAFSKAYLLRGANEDAIRRLFDDELIAFLQDEAAGKREIELAGGHLLVYRAGKKVAPDELRDLMATGLRYLKAMQAAAARTGFASADGRLATTADGYAASIDPSDDLSI